LPHFSDVEAFLCFCAFGSAEEACGRGSREIEGRLFCRLSLYCRMQLAMNVMIRSRKRLKNKRPLAHPKNPYGMMSSFPSVEVGVVAP